LVHADRREVTPTDLRFAVAVSKTPDLIAVNVKNNATGQWLVCGVTVAAMVKDCPHGLRALEVAKLIEVGLGGVLTPPEPPPPVSPPPEVVPPPPPHPRTKHRTQAVDRAKPAPRGLGLRAIVDNDRTATTQKTECPPIPERWRK